jgi:RNA polymerase sigma-70 factor (ECF subfamily)
MFFQRRTVQADFEREVMPHLQALYGVALRMTKSEGDAEDLVQDAILRAYRFWDGFEAGSNCRAWLMRIMTNLFPQPLPRAGARTGDPGRGRKHLGQPGAIPGRGPSRRGKRALSAACSRATWRRRWKPLPPEFRLPVILADLEDLSYKEIADIMECPAGTVMSRLYRGRKMLQKAARRLRGVPEAQQTSQRPSRKHKLVDFESFRRKKQEGGAA